MVTTYDVLTLDEAKSGLRIDDSDDIDDEIVQRLVTTVSRRLDRLIGPTITRSVTSEIHSGGHCAIELEFGPVTAITVVTEYQGTTARVLTEQTPGTQPSEGWVGERYKPNRQLYSGIVLRMVSGSRSHFYSGTDNVTFTYTAGRVADVDDVEERIKEAAVITMRNLWRSYEISSGRVDEYDVPTQNFPMFGIPNAAKQLLQDMWRPEVGFGA